MEGVLVDKSQTPLVAACLSGHLSIASLLLNNNASIDNPCKDGTALFAVCNVGCFEAAHFLLERRANPNYSDIGGFTPLFVAADANDPLIVSLLIEWNADVDQADDIGLTPLMLASGAGNIDIVDLLIMGSATVDKQALSGQTALAVACRNGWVDTVSILLNAKADPNLTAQDMAPLFHACVQGHLDIVTLLCRHGADVDTTDSDGFDCLAVACMNEQMDLVRLLLCLGASGNSNQAKHTHLVQTSLDDLRHPIRLWLEACIGWNRMQHACEARRGDIFVYLARSHRLPIDSASCASNSKDTWSLSRCALADSTLLGPLALPVSKALVSLVSAAMQNWSPETYFLWPLRVRRASWVLFLTFYSFLKKQALFSPAEDKRTISLLILKTILSFIHSDWFLSPEIMTAISST